MSADEGLNDPLLVGELPDGREGRSTTDESSGQQPQQAQTRLLRVLPERPD